MTGKTLSQRMKNFEQVTDYRLTDKIPVILRLDGRAFHTFTRGLEKPFDEVFSNCMCITLQRLCENITNCLIGYTQSDEITLLLYDGLKIESQPWFDNRLEKIVSQAASMATLFFNEAIAKYSDIPRFKNKQFLATFDCRAFNIPLNEVVNNFIWRQNDATKNSINSVAQFYFSHKQLQNKNGSEMQDMLMLEKGINWNDTPTRFKRGIACIKTPVEVSTSNGFVMRNKWTLDYEMPILTKDKNYIEKYLTL